VALPEQKKRILEDLVVELLLAIRAEYMATSQANVMKHWTLIQDRVRASARTTATAEEFVTWLRRGLRLDAPSKDSSRCSTALVSEVRDETDGRAFVELVEARHAYLLARTRVAAEERKIAKESANAAG
jgi:hypothetical protein